MESSSFLPLNKNDLFSSWIDRDLLNAIPVAFSIVIIKFGKEIIFICIRIEFALDKFVWALPHNLMGPNENAEPVGD